MDGTAAIGNIRIVSGGGGMKQLYVSEDDMMEERESEGSSAD